MSYEEPFIFRHLGKVIVALGILFVASATWLAYSAAKAVDACQPSMIHQTIDGKDVTSVECKP